MVFQDISLYTAFVLKSYLLAEVYVCVLGMKFCVLPLMFALPNHLPVVQCSLHKPHPCMLAPPA